jgi:chromosomal replication initiator protein
VYEIPPTKGHFRPCLGRAFADGADVVDYLTEIPLPGRRLATPPVAGDRRRANVVSPAFVAGPENRLVAATFERLLATKSLAPSAASNYAAASAPAVLALFGPSGTGKTHLAHGLVRHWQQQHGTESGSYLTAGDFRRQYTAAIADDAILGFRSRLRGPQLLSIDDLHQLPADAHLWHELRYTLDDFDDRGGTVVVTSNRPATTLANLPPDVRSRLAGGLMLQLAAPGAVARLRIIHQTSTAFGQPLSAADAERLAAGLSGTANDLIGALFELCSTPAKNASNDANRTSQLLATRASRRPSLREIVAAVARFTRVPQKQLKSSSRKQSAVFARALVVYLARELAGSSYHEVGRALGGRDHTTIMHSYQKISGDRLRNAATQNALDELTRTLLSR